MVRGPGRGGLPLASRMGMITVAALAPAVPAGQQGDGLALPLCARSLGAPAARAALADAEGCAESEDGLCLQPGLLQTGTRLRPPIEWAAQLDGESYAEAEEGPCMQPGFLQTGGALLTPEGNATLLPLPVPEGAWELGDVGRTASPEHPAMIAVHAVRLLGQQAAVQAVGSATTMLIVVLPLLVVLALCGCCLLRSREGPGDVGRSAWDPAGGKLLDQPPAKGRPGPGRSPGPSTHSLPPRGGPQQAQRPQTHGAIGFSRVPEESGQLAPSPAARPTVGSSGAASAPILCRSLVLPNLESVFNISAEALLSRRLGNLQIKGASERTLLECAVQERQLSIRSVGNDARPRATVRKDGGALNIYGREDSFFGSLEAASGPNDCGLVQDGEVRMKVLAEPGGQLQFRAFAMDGQQLAAGGCVHGEWRLQVRANADAILITSCVLAMIFFSPAARSSIATPVSTTPQPSISRQPTPQASASVSRSPPPPAHPHAPGSRTSPHPPVRRP